MRYPAVGLFDHVTPSERAIDLGMFARRQSKKIGGDIVVLVVEGMVDESLWRRILLGDHCHVYAAGTRALVEGVLEELRDEPVAGCSCVFLTDCDGYGKTARLAAAPELVVTQCCDIEADSVALGLLRRTLERVVRESEAAAEVVDEASRVGMAISQVRRAAAREYVSMKRQQRRFELEWLSWTELEQALEGEDSGVQVTQMIGRELGWNSEELARVEAGLAEVATSFSEVCSGKDVYQAVVEILRRRGIRSPANVVELRERVWSELEPGDMSRWAVAKKLREWQELAGCELI